MESKCATAEVSPSTGAYQIRYTLPLPVWAHRPTPSKTLGVSNPTLPRITNETTFNFWENGLRAHPMPNEKADLEPVAADCYRSSCCLWMRVFELARTSSVMLISLLLEACY